MSLPDLGTSRWFLGAAISDSGDEAHAALIRLDGAGWGPRVELDSSATVRIAPRDKSPTDRLIDCCEMALAASSVSRERVLAIGVDECYAQEAPHACPPSPRINSAAVAAATGLTTLDAWPHADWACGGSGHTYRSVAAWLHLRHLIPAAAEGVWLVDLGHSIDATWLPSSKDRHAVDAIRASTTVPGFALIDAVCHQLGGAAASNDRRGLRAVQGRQIQDLASRLVLVSPHEIDRHATDQAASLHDADAVITAARREQWNLDDVLCTLTHCAAKATAKAMQTEHVSNSASESFEIWYTGIGRENGLAVREVGRHFQRALGRRLDTLGITADVAVAIHAGLLAYLFVEQLPAGRAALSGAHADRVLGRLTPADPAATIRLVRAMSGRASSPLPLRSPSVRR